MSGPGLLLAVSALNTRGVQEQLRASELERSAQGLSSALGSWHLHTPVQEKTLNAPNGSPGITQACPSQGRAAIPHPQARRRRCHPARTDEGLSGALQFSPPPRCKGLGLRLQQL